MSPSTSAVTERISKAGFREAGRVRGAAVLGGVRYDNVLMDITRDEVDLTRVRSIIKLLDD